MEAGSATARGRMGWRLWAVVPVLLLAIAVGLVVTSGASLVDLVGTNPPPADEFDIRRVEFSPGEIRITVRNPQPDDLTIANVNVDDAIVPFTVDGPTELGRLRSSTIVVPFDWVEEDPITVGVTSSTGIETVEEIPAAIATVTVDDAVVPFDVDGPATLGRLRSSTIVIPFDWVQDDPISVGITSSTGIQTVEEIPAAVETPGASPSSVLGYGIIGFLVGIVPVALRLAWLPSLRRAAPHWLAAFMALTAGLLSFLAVEALSEA
ncbi:MAG: hypothetical protein H0T97_00525, partial [Actinobacteria bacterium]|nr:hypothetical protein [Actinomycetota bacterium]